MINMSWTYFSPDDGYGDETAAETAKLIFWINREYYFLVSLYAFALIKNTFPWQELGRILRRTREGAPSS
jgi:hypothetical protein